MSWIRKWKKSKVKYSWKDITRACERVLTGYDGPEISQIVALSRGGLVPGTIAANMLGVRKLYSIGLASYELDATGQPCISKHEVYQQLSLDCPDMRKGEHVLIIDDISDKGTTFEHVMHEHMSRYECDFTTMALYVKPQTRYIPDLYYKMVDQDLWVVFPWEKELVAHAARNKYNTQQ